MLPLTISVRGSVVAGDIDYLLGADISSLLFNFLGSLPFHLALLGFARAL